MLKCRYVSHEIASHEKYTPHFKSIRKFRLPHSHIEKKHTCTTNFYFTLRVGVYFCSMTLVCSMRRYAVSLICDLYVFVDVSYAHLSHSCWGGTTTARCETQCIAIHLYTQLLNSRAQISLVHSFYVLISPSV